MQVYNQQQQAKRYDPTQTYRVSYADQNCLGEIKQVCIQFFENNDQQLPPVLLSKELLSDKGMEQYMSVSLGEGQLYVRNNRHHLSIYDQESIF